MCMEPLLKNIDRNPLVVSLNSTLAGGELPKTYAYADDVSATIKDNEMSLRALFQEYERLTKMSGLELNADKTELMRIGLNVGECTYNVDYASGHAYACDLCVIRRMRLRMIMILCLLLLCLFVCIW